MPPAKNTRDHHFRAFPRKFTKIGHLFSIFRLGVSLSKSAVFSPLSKSAVFSFVICLGVK